MISEHMNTVDESDYMNALMVTSMLYQYELKNEEIKKQFDDLTNIISNYDDTVNAYGTRFIGWV